MAAIAACLLVGEGRAASRFEMGSHSVKLYRIAISADMMCANPVVIYENSAPEFRDIMQKELLLTPKLDGIFRCLMLEISDRVRVGAAANASEAKTCSAEHPSEARICPPGAETESIDGRLSICGGGENRITLYYSLASQDQTGRSKLFLAPISRRDHLHGLRLASPISLKATISYRLRLDGASTLVAEGAERCRLVQPPRATIVE